MSSPAKTWLLPILLYAAFVAWYTDFGGPLTPDEIDAFMAVMQLRGASAEALEGVEKFMREDTGKQCLMVNILDTTDNPPDVEGAEPGESAEALVSRYMAYMFPALLWRASHPAFMGEAIHPEETPMRPRHQPVA